MGHLCSSNITLATKKVTSFYKYIKGLVHLKWLYTLLCYFFLQVSLKYGLPVGKMNVFLTRAVYGIFNLHAGTDITVACALRIRHTMPDIQSLLPELRKARVRC